MVLLFRYAGSLAGEAGIAETIAALAAPSFMCPLTFSRQVRVALLKLTSTYAALLDTSGHCVLPTPFREIASPANQKFAARPFAPAPIWPSYPRTKQTKQDRFKAPLSNGRRNQHGRLPPASKASKCESRQPSCDHRHQWSTHPVSIQASHSSGNNAQRLCLDGS